ncbi:hypothetical protein [Roseibium sp.]|uniref:hypothetical protein n=1 Tax=Roseibium sp. TaxID=1936156 RepID=UPI0039EDF00F
MGGVFCALLLEELVEEEPGLVVVDVELVLALALVPVLPAPAVDDDGLEVEDDVPGRDELYDDVGFVSALSVFVPVPAFDPKEDDVEDPVAPVLGTPEADLPSVDALPVLPATFSAVRSMVTGRLEPVCEEVGEVLPDLSPGPFPSPPEEDVPPEDFLSVAIYSPPEPAGSKMFTIHASQGSKSSAASSICALQNSRLPRFWLTLC